MAEPIWLDRLLIDAIHWDQLRQHGGRHGVRDEGLIESALARPRRKRRYKPSCDIAPLAAAYAYGFARNHGFVDGNKRVAFLALYVFLGLDGFSFDASEEEVVAVIGDLASGRLAEDELAVWVRQNASPGRP